MPPARDSGEAVPVERGAIGAADAFDGNHTRGLVTWLFANERWTDEKVEKMLDQLMYYTINDHLAWVVFPPSGFRL